MLKAEQVNRNCCGLDSATRSPPPYFGNRAGNTPDTALPSRSCFRSKAGKTAAALDLTAIQAKVKDSAFATRQSPLEP